MKRIKQFLGMGITVVVLLVLSAGLTDAQGPVGTVFTYQGRLTDGGVAPTGSYDFEFKLYPTVVAGTQIGSTYTRNDVSVTSGLFVVDLDFGVNPYTGQALYLQVGVRAGASTGAYTTLLPRQKLTPTPYALFASAPWATSGSAINYAAGNVGIGTTAPTSKLEIAAQDGLAITGYQPYMTLRDSNASNKRGVIQGAGGSVNIYTESGLNQGVVGLTVKDVTGNVGIGTGTPADKLTVVTAAGAYGLTHTDGTAVVGTFVGSGAGGGEAGWLGTKTNHPLRFFAANAGAAMTIDTNNKVGIGTLTPSAQLSVLSPSGTLPLTVKQNAAESATPGFAAFETSNGTVGSLGANIGTFVVGAATGKALGFNVNNTTRALTIGSDGNVGIGTNIINAKVHIRGNTSDGTTDPLVVTNSDGVAKLRVDDYYGVHVQLFGSADSHVCYNDLGGGGQLSTCLSAAEYVPTIDGGSGFPETADVVSIIPKVPNPYDDEHGPFVVAKSSTACDPNLLGFIVNPESGADGVKKNDHYLPLAIYGYFPAKVTPENGVIKRGDPLTSSSKVGYAMKATGACRIIGYALEDADAEGQIQVFANTGETAIGQVGALQEQLNQQAAQIAELEQKVETLQQSQAAQLNEIKQELAALKQQGESAQPQTTTETGVNLSWLVLGGIVLGGVVWLRRGTKEQ